MTPYLVRSAQPIPLAWSPLFKFPHSATSLGHKSAKRLARSFLGPMPTPTLCVHQVLFMISTRQQPSPESLLPKTAPGVLMKLFNPFAHTYLCSASNRLPVANSQSYKVILVSVQDRIVGSQMSHFCPHKADMVQTTRHCHHSHTQSLQSCPLVTSIKHPGCHHPLPGLLPQAYNWFHCPHLVPHAVYSQ